MRGPALAALILAIASCDPRDERAAAAKTDTTGAACEPPLILESDLSTPADFEAAAARSISRTTYKTELIVLGFEIARR